MKLYLFVVLWLGVDAFPAPEKTNAREPRLANLLGNYKNWDPATVAVSCIMFLYFDFELLSYNIRLNGFVPSF